MRARSQRAHLSPGKSARHPGVKKVTDHLIAFVAANPHALRLFAQAFDEPGRKAFIDHIKPVIANSGLCTEKELDNTDWFSTFTGGCKTQGKNIIECVAEANHIMSWTYLSQPRHDAS